MARYVKTCRLSVSIDVNSLHYQYAHVGVSSFGACCVPTSGNRLPGKGKFPSLHRHNTRQQLSLLHIRRRWVELESTRDDIDCNHGESEPCRSLSTDNESKKNSHGLGRAMLNDRAKQRANRGQSELVDYH